MGAIVQFKNEVQREASAVLQDSMEQGFEAVFVIGLLPDGSVSIRNSATNDTVKALGMLEAAKLHLYEKWG